MTALNPILGIEHTFENFSSDSGRDVPCCSAFYNINPKFLWEIVEDKSFRDLY